MPEHHIEVGFRRKIQRVVQRAGAFGPHAHLPGGFLGGHIEGDPVEFRPPAGDLQKQRGFPHPGFARQQHDGSGNNAAAQHPVELPDAGGLAGGFCCGNGGDFLGRGGGREPLGDHPGGCCLGGATSYGGLVFLHGPPGAALRAAAQPFGAGVAAFGAAVNRARFFGHGLTLDHAADIRFHPSLYACFTTIPRRAMSLSYACSRYVIDGDFAFQRCVARYHCDCPQLFSYYRKDEC